MAPPQLNDEYHKQVKNARQQLNKLISSNKHYYAPLMLHLGLHDAGIYRLHTCTEDYLIKGGPNGSIRTEEELKHPSNKGLKEAVALCEDVKKKNDKITYADLFQLAGVAAVEITGGPEIEFVPGREDSSQNPEQGRLPPNNQLDESQMEKITKRMGLEDKDMVALIGGLHQWNLPVDERAEGKDPKKTSDDNEKKAESFKFDNSYFKDLKQRQPDNPLLRGARFRKWVETYSKDNNAFLKDYGVAHKKVSELGTSLTGGGGHSEADQKSSVPSSRNRVRLVQGIGIAVVTTAIILGFFLSRRSK